MNIASETCDNLFFHVQELEKLGAKYWELKDYKVAEVFYKESLALFRKYNVSSNYIARHLTIIGVLCYAQKKYEEAEILLTEALEIKKKISGDGLDIGNTLANLALIYDRQENYEKAEAFYSEAIKLMKEAVDENRDKLAFRLKFECQIAVNLYLLAELFRKRRLDYTARLLSVEVSRAAQSIADKDDVNPLATLKTFAMRFYEQGEAYSSTILI